MNEYQSRYIDLLEGNGPRLSEQQKQELYDRLFVEAMNDPQGSKELDIRVLNAAYGEGISSDIATRIVAQGPYIQSQLEQQAPIAPLLTDYLTPLSTAYVRREAADAIAVIRAERQSVVEQSSTPTVSQVVNAPQALYQTSAVFLGAGYNVLRVAEQSLFAVTPLPLQQLKNGIQQVGVPLGVAAVASKVPGLEQLINGAVELGGDLLGNGASAAAGNALSSIGQQIQSGIPNGFGIQSVTGALGNAISPVVSNLAERSGQFFGETLTAAGIGKFVITGAQAVYSQVREKGAIRTIEDAIVVAQGAISRTKDFLQSAQTRITNFIQGEKAVSQHQIAQDYNDASRRSQILRGSIGVGESDASIYARRVDGSRKDVDFIQSPNPSYQVVAGEYLVPKDGMRLNPMNVDTLQAIYDIPSDFNLDKYQTVQDMHLATPARVAVGNDGNYHLVEKGRFIAPELAEQQTSGPDWSSQYESPAELNGNEFSPEVPNETNETAYTPPLPSEEADETIYTPPEAEESEDYTVPKPKPEQTPVAKAAAPEKAPIQKENEDYALSLQNMLSQRNIETQSFQVNVNGEMAFKMENALVTHNSLDAQAVEAIKTALNDPANLKGEVRITQGQKVLLHVKDGQIINDPLGLTKPSAKVEVNSPSQSLYTEASKDVPGSGLQRTQAIAVNAFETGATQVQVMEMIKNHDPEFKNQVRECGSEQAATMAISAAVRAAETQVAVSQQSQSTQNKEPAMQR